MNLFAAVVFIVLCIAFALLLFIGFLILFTSPRKEQDEEIKKTRAEIFGGMAK